MMLRKVRVRKVMEKKIRSKRRRTGRRARKRMITKVFSYVQTPLRLGNSMENIPCL